MWNGNVGKARAVFLAVSIASIAGCDIGAPPPQAAQGAIAPQSQAIQLRYQVDPARDRVWLLTRDGVLLYDAAALEKAVVALPDWHWAGMPYGCLPDLALGPNGEAIITSDVAPTLWRIDPETLSVSVHQLVPDSETDKDLGFSGLVYSPAHGAFFAIGSLQGSLWRIDPLLRRAQKITLSAPLPKACGLAMQSRVAQQKKSARLAGLCVRAPQGTWTVDFAPDQRSAYVRAATCPDA